MVEEITTDENRCVRRTQWAFIGIRLMSAPCWCLLSMLVFILYKNLHLNPLQITIIVALKPTSSLLSAYWSQAIYQRPDKIIKNLLGANVFRHLLFLIIPWVQSSWVIIVAFGVYMMLTRASIPAWMELFKHNLPKQKREEMVSYGTIIDYLGTAILAIGMGILLDRYETIWKWLFFISSAIGVLSSLFLMHANVRPGSEAVAKREFQQLSFRKEIFKPWQQVWRLISQRKDFTIFQIGFMLGGSGLMIMQPALPQFFIDVLHLSFTEMGIAIAFCKGVGVALTSPLWTRLFRKANIFQLSALVTFFAACFPLFLLATSFHLSLLYLAYAFYGIMQAGSELSWHMSGLVFAQEKDSSPFSLTNVLTVGMRGCIVPVLGSLLLPWMHSLGVILLGAFICLFASGYFLFNTYASLSLADKSKP